MEGVLGAAQRPLPLFLQLAHCDEAAAFGGVRSGGAPVFQDAESLVQGHRRLLWSGDSVSGTVDVAALFPRSSVITHQHSGDSF